MLNNMSVFEPGVNDTIDPSRTETEKAPQGFLGALENAYSTDTKTNQSFSYENTLSRLENGQIEKAQQAGITLNPLSDVHAGYFDKSLVWNSSPYKMLGNNDTSNDELNKHIQEHDDIIKKANAENPNLNLLTYQQMSDAVKADAKQTNYDSSIEKRTWGGTAGMLAGGIIASLNPYSNSALGIASNFVGGFGKNIATRALVNAGVAGGTTAVEDLTSVNNERQMLGLPKNNVLKDTAMSALGGAAISVGLDGLSHSLDNIRGENPMAEFAEKNKNLEPAEPIDNNVSVNNDPILSDLYAKKIYGDHIDANAKVTEDLASTASQLETFGGPTLNDLEYMIKKEGYELNEDRQNILETNGNDIDGLADSIDPNITRQYNEVNDGLERIEYARENMRDDYKALPSKEEQQSIVDAREKISKNNANIDNINNNLIQTNKDIKSLKSQITKNNKGLDSIQDPDTLSLKKQHIAELNNKLNDAVNNKNELGSKLTISKSKNKDLEEIASKKTREEIDPIKAEHLNELDALEDRYINRKENLDKLYNRQKSIAQNKNPIGERLSEQTYTEHPRGEDTSLEPQPSNIHNDIPEVIPTEEGAHYGSKIEPEGLKVSKPTIEDRFNINTSEDGSKSIKIGDTEFKLDDKMPYIDDEGNLVDADIKSILDDLNDIASLEDGAFKKACDFCSNV